MRPAEEQTDLCAQFQRARLVADLPSPPSHVQDPDWKEAKARMLIKVRPSFNPKRFFFLSSRIFTDVRCVIEPLTWCNELSPGRDRRREQLQFSESFPDSWTLCTISCVPFSLWDTLLATFVSTVCFSECKVCIRAVYPVRQTALSRLQIQDRNSTNFSFYATFNSSKKKQNQDWGSKRADCKNCVS